MKSSLWKKIIKCRGYRGHYIIDTHNKPDNHRTGGFFFVLMVFFERTTDRTLNSYLIEGRMMIRREGLDNPPIHPFYGGGRMIRFS